MKYGYTRPIVQDRQGKQQLHDMTIDHVFKEEHGLAKKRSVLENLLMDLQKSDELFVQNIVVLADSIQNFLDLLLLAERDGIIIHFIDEKITTKSIQKLSILESTRFFASLQTELLSHSSTFALQNAKEQGKLIGRPRKKDKNLQLAFKMYDSKEYTLFDIKSATGISKSTLYRYLDERDSTT